MSRKTNLYKNIKTNMVYTFEELREMYAQENGSDLPIDDGTMQFIIYGYLAQNGGNFDLIKDDILAWCNDFSEHNEADRYLSRSERDDSVKTIYLSIVDKSDYLEHVKESLNEDCEECRELLERLEQLVNKKEEKSMKNNRLEALLAQNKKVNEVVKEINDLNKQLEEELKQKEAMKLEQFLDSMAELAAYGAEIVNLNKMRVCGDTGIVLDFYQGSYGDSPTIQFEIYSTGDFVFTARPSGYSGYVKIYDSKANGWNWYKEKCMPFFAQHSVEILDAVQKKLEEILQNVTRRKLDAACEKQNMLIVTIRTIEEV